MSAVRPRQRRHEFAIDFRTGGAEDRDLVPESNQFPGQQPDQ